jgi:hypothetical protein
MDFVDEFRRVRDPRMLADEPERLSAQSDQGAVQDAYLAAVAVTLAREVGAIPPAWAKACERVLPWPWFAHPGAALRATLLAESPAAFRERNLFVSANALSRA